MNIKTLTTYIIESKQGIFKYGNYFENFIAFILKPMVGGKDLPYKFSCSMNNIRNIILNKM